MTMRNYTWVIRQPKRAKRKNLKMCTYKIKNGLSKKIEDSLDAEFGSHAKELTWREEMSHFHKPHS